jgi:hypothetical protein
MKSEVKKKMMLDEHATDTPKSPKRAQVENFFAGNALIGSADNNSREKFDETLVPPSSLRRLIFTNKSAMRAAACSTEFILFCLSTSIIQRHKIFAGAHKWRLSTML